MCDVKLFSKNKIHVFVFLNQPLVDENVFTFPSRPCSPTDFWLYPQTDSSYDSLENELDALDCSPEFSRQQQSQTRPKQLSGSLDSVLAFSDTDPDTGVVKRTCRRLKQNKKEEGEETLGAFDSLSLDDKQRRRRSSEPALLSEGGHVTEVEGESIQRPLGVKTSSSTPASPELRCASPHSSEPQCFVAGRGRQLSSKASTGEAALRGTCPKSPPPVDATSWARRSGYRSLHPNSWLKKERKLSLTQQEHLEKDTTRASMTSAWTFTTMCAIYKCIISKIDKQLTKDDLGPGKRKKYASWSKVCPENERFRVQTLAFKLGYSGISGVDRPMISRRGIAAVWRFPGNFYPVPFSFISRILTYFTLTAYAKYTFLCFLRLQLQDS